MKLLVFAHNAPPVKFVGIECYQVDRCLEAIWCRLRHGVRAFYYVPAPGKRAALYRDWIVMLLCRPFFSQFIHHWQVAGLGDWLEREGTWFERWLTRRLLGRPALGIAPAIPRMRDALWFRTERVEVVPDSLPDPCPDFDAVVLPHRRERVDRCRAALAGGEPHTARVLFVTAQWRYEDLDTVLAVLARGGPVRLQLTMVGPRLRPGQEQEIEERLPREIDRANVSVVASDDVLVSGAWWRESDCLLLPQSRAGEEATSVVLAALAHGLPVVLGEESLMELLPREYSGVVRTRRLFDFPKLCAKVILRALGEDPATIRASFLAHYAPEPSAQRLSAVLRQLEV